MSEPQYKVTMQMRSSWFVGYHREHDEMFLYFIDQDELFWIFHKGGLDAIGFYEFINFSSAELLGEL
jgi:hypothetical protein